MQNSMSWEGQKMHIQKVMGWLGENMEMDAKVFKEDTKALGLLMKIYGSDNTSQKKQGSANANGTKRSNFRGSDQRKCYTCGETGHIAARCNKAGGGSGEPGKSKEERTCYKCGVAGHIARDCTTKNGADGAAKGK